MGSLNRLWIIIVLIIAILPSVSAYVNADAVNNADTYIRSDQKTANYGNDTILGVYGNGSLINTLMNWTLPEGNGDIAEVALTMYCKKWDNFTTTPVELRVLNEPFEESNATWIKSKSSTDWTNTGAGAPKSMNSTVVDSIPVGQEGFYTWVLRGPDAVNSLNSLIWGDTINIALTLPNETGYKGIQCDSKEWPYNQPYMVVTDEAPKTPLIINVTAIKVRKTSALINTITNIPTTNILVNYGINSSNLDLWNYADSLSNSSYNLLEPLTPDTTYYYRVYASNYIDNIHKAVSPILSFTTGSNNSYIPLVTFVFDDGWESTFTNASSVLNASMFPGVSAVITNMPDVGPAYMNWTQVQKLQNTYGWEIASHTTSHANMSTLNKSQLEYELGNSRTTLENKGLNVHNFIAPEGAYNYFTEAYVMRYYDSDRTVYGGPIAPPYNEFPLYAKVIENYTTLSDVERWVDSAAVNNSWLILVFHKIVDSDPMAMEWTKSNLTNLTQYVEANGKLRVVTIREAQTISFNYKGIYASTATKSITNTVYPNGTVYYSKTLTGHPRINAAVLPSSDPVLISIALWNTTGDYKIIFEELSVNASNKVRYILGDRQANTNYSVRIYWNNGTLFQNFYTYSNTSGYISYDTTGSENPRYTVIQSTVIQPTAIQPTIEGSSSYNLTTGNAIIDNTTYAMLSIYNELPGPEKVLAIAAAAMVVIICIALVFRVFIHV